MGSKSPPKQVTQGGPTYSQEQSKILGLERNLFENIIQPAEASRIDALKNLIGGNFEGAQSILSPAMSAARQGQSRLQASMSELPRNISAPIEEAAAWQIRGMPRRMQAAAPDELAKMVQQLMSPQFGSLMQPGSQSTTSGGGSSGMEKNLAIAGTVATVAAIGIAI
jgi:hypothetical protein